jgi:formiminotetrahydrofolate cyclodeaminase
MYPELSLETFLTRLASSAPEPGGGAAAALAGATAAALVGMVANLTVGKPQFADAQVEMEHARDRADALRAGLLAAVDRDSIAFRSVMDAYALPRATDDDKGARRVAIQQALRVAAQEPADVVRMCREVADCSGVAAERGNPNVLSDAAVAALLAEAGAAGAAYNVQVNVKLITDAAFNAQIWAAVQADLHAAREARDRTLRVVAARLG